jgi:hypothetical protein
MKYPSAFLFYFMHLQITYFPNAFNRKFLIEIVFEQIIIIRVAANAL